MISIIPLGLQIYIALGSIVSFLILVVLFKDEGDLNFDNDDLWRLIYFPPYLSWYMFKSKYFKKNMSAMLLWLFIAHGIVVTLLMTIAIYLFLLVAMMIYVYVVVVEYGSCKLKGLFDIKPSKLNIKHKLKNFLFKERW